MTQPELLKSTDFLPWSRARGNDVWAMFRAVIDGDMATVKLLAVADPNLVECEFEYRKPLHFAVREDRREVVEFLLERGANPAYTSGSSWHESPLTIARDRGYAEVLALLEQKLKREYNVVPGGAPVAEIIRSRNLAKLKETIDARPKLIFAADERGNQPIHWAVMTRQMPMIDLLLDGGADVNARRPDGARPLDLTNGDYWYRGWRDVPAHALQKPAVLIGYLLARGADYDISVAAKIGDVERVRELLDQNPSLVNQVPPYSTYYSGLPLRCAAAAGHLAVVKLLLDRGANPSQPEPIAPKGGALREAIGGEHYEIARLLLEHGADPNAMVESSGNSMWAAKDGGPEIRNLLASYGAVVGLEIACYQGDVPLVGAMLYANPALHINEASLSNVIENGHQRLMELLLRHQPDILKQASFLAAKTPEFARWLMERGLDPNRANWLGVTPLHRLAMTGDRAQASACLDFGADINALDDEYCSTPLGWAARCGQKETVNWLLEKGARRDLPADRPWAHPAAWAERRGHGEILAMLQSSADAVPPREC